MGRLDGKVAMVTGAGRGHAEAVALRFAKEGASLSICDIIPVKELEDTVGAKIKALGAKVICFKTDVSNEAEVNKMVQDTIAKFGKIDILANVVGIAGPTKDIWQMSLEEWRKTLEVNIDSAFLCARAVIPDMMKRNWGRIINFSSPTGKQPLTHRAPYATSKMAIIGFTRTLAADVGRYNISVNAICPGTHLERSLELSRDRAQYMGRSFDPEVFRKRIQEFQNTPNPKRVLAGRWASDEGYQDRGSGSEEAAALAAFLASDDAATMTGQDINTDGGCMW
jgi:NAD(P)-dependent dehydrogenase (short-subunit alcohol dehydrogenase family)